MGFFNGIFENEWRFLKSMEIFENDICNGFLKMNGEFFQCVCFGGDGFDDWKRYECGLLMVVVVIGMDMMGLDMMGLDWYGLEELVDGGG